MSYILREIGSISVFFSACWERLDEWENVIWKCVFLCGQKWALANQIAVFLNQLYLKSIRVNQRDFFHADIEWRKIKVDLKIFIGQVKNAIGESECIIPESTMS